MTDSGKAKRGSNRPAHSAQPQGKPPFAQVTAHLFTHQNHGPTDLPLHIGTLAGWVEGQGQVGLAEFWVLDDPNDEDYYLCEVRHADGTVEPVCRHGMLALAVLSGQLMLLADAAWGLTDMALKDARRIRSFDHLLNALQATSNIVSEIGIVTTNKLENLVAEAGAAIPGVKVQRVEVPTRAEDVPPSDLQA